MDADTLTRLTQTLASQGFVDGVVKQRALKGSTCTFGAIVRLASMMNHMEVWLLRIDFGGWGKTAWYNQSDPVLDSIEWLFPSEVTPDPPTEPATPANQTTPTHCRRCENWGETIPGTVQIAGVRCPDCGRMTWPNLGVNLPAGCDVAIGSRMAEEVMRCSN